MATTAAYGTFRRVYDNPSIIHRRMQSDGYGQYYNLLAAYYSNSVFDTISNWTAYKSTNRLYRQTRAIFNPTRRLVNFYAGNVYRGRLSKDGLPFNDGTDLAIPFAPDSDPDLLTAIAQLWQWTNWLDGKDQMVGLAAMVGECLVEVVDEVDRGKVTFEIRWPGWVDFGFLDLDAGGNVKAYALEYQSFDEMGQSYIYRKEVDQDEFRYYKDGALYDYGNGARVPNMYGFVPAVWVRHQMMDAVHGAPAIQGSLNKLDELNSLASLIHDEIAKTVASPVLITGTGQIGSLFAQPKKGATEDEPVPDADREAWPILKGGADADMKKLPLQLADGVPYIEKLLNEIEHDFPELGMYQKLSDMTQVTGPAAERLMGNVAGKLDSVAARHDQQSVKLFTMAVAIAGERVRRGDWGSLNRQQEKFRPFSLESYERGDLDLEIMARRLFKPTEKELADERLVRVQTAVQLDGIVDERERILAAGYDEEEVDEILARKGAEDEKKAERALAIAGARVPQMIPAESEA